MPRLPELPEILAIVAILARLRVFMRRTQRFSVLLAGVALILTIGIKTQQPATPDSDTFVDIDDHFKYGSIGTEERVGIPYWIWKVLPIVFEDKLPKRPGVGYERIGFLVDESRHLRPIGTSYKEGRVSTVGLNCATCHVGTYRETVTSPRQIVSGMPANQMDLQGYANFLTACANDPRFNYGTLMAAIRKVNPDIGWFQRVIYRLFVVGATKKGILRRARENVWFDSRPPFGVGRVDTFNPYKIILRIPIDDTVGTVDLPSLWNQRMRARMWLHWDGNNDSVEERNKSAAIGAGATPDSLNLVSMSRIEAWILDLKPPAYPAARIDMARAKEGFGVWEQACASCHAVASPDIGQVTPIADVGTDPERVNSFSAELARGMNTIGEGKPWRFNHFRKTNGYANMPLDGLWLRAPYLHNGSVPHLRALLFPEERPKVFYRGYDVYDWQNVGFVSSGPEAEAVGIPYDTSLKGNSNAGHVYGAKLSRQEREALLEYLKTL
jgi:mono/diheme cytochrome c family protein